MKLLKVGLIAVAVTMLSSSCLAAEDGGAIMKKLSAAYLALKSYDQKSSVTQVTNGPGVNRLQGCTADVRYQSPNKVYVGVSAPQTGTIAGSSDGRSQIIYRSASNAFTKYPAPANLREFMQRMAPFGVAAMLDPVYFLQGVRTDLLVSNLKLVGTETVNGAACYKVRGTMKAGLAPNGSSGTITFLVDKRQYLLRKTIMTISRIPYAARVMKMQNGKRVPTTHRIYLNQTLTETIQEMRPNPALNDAAFAYKAPKGATEQAAPTPAKR